MTKLKQIMWAVVSIAAAIIGAVLFGKFRRLKQLEVEAKVSKANEALKATTDKYNKSKEKSDEALKNYRDALDSYRKHRDS